MMHDALLILTWLTPLLLAATTVVAPRLTWKAMVFAGLPGLAAAFMVPAGSTIEVSGLLFGTRFGLDQVGMGFLFFTSAIWTLAGWHAIGYISTRRSSFAVHFLLAMAGNFGLILAQDMVGFYLFFALMSFASYGLVIHDRNPQARYAGKVYIILVVLGEVLIFSGMTGAATLAGSTLFGETGGAWVGEPRGAFFFGALLLGFGIKAGALPLHVWLPLAHPAAPTPASAILSGAMIKAGLLGWLRFLPVGEATLPGWGAVCVGLGAIAFIAAAVYGCLQENPKALLAYSSISKMGLMTIAVGAVLANPGSAEVVVPCILVFATHHCLCKGALFLIVSIHHKDVSPGPLRWLISLLLFVPPLSLAGFALTGGAVAKSLMKVGLSASMGETAQNGLAAVLILNSLFTAALMFRFCFQRFTSSHQTHQTPGRACYYAWGILVGLVIATPLLAAMLYPDIAPGKSFSLRALWNAAWPVLAVGGTGAVLLHRPRQYPTHWPAGDMLHLYILLARSFARLIEWVTQIITALNTKVSRGRFVPPGTYHLLTNLLRQGEFRLGRAAVFGLVFIGLITFSTFLLLEQI